MKCEVATGLRVSKEKTKVMRTKSKQWDKIKLNGEDLEDVERFTFLGTINTATGGAEEDVKCRTGKARLAFNILRQSGMTPRFPPKPICASSLQM